MSNSSSRFARSFEDTLTFFIFGVNVGHLWDEHEMIRDWMRQILEWQLQSLLF